MSIPVCDWDCFNCPHDDCIQDGVSDEEVKASAALDREARMVNKDNRQRELAERKRRYYEQNKDEIAEYNRRYYRRKKEGVKSGMQVDTE